MSNILYVYGTLRPGKAEIYRVVGSLYDLGWFPGIKLDGANEVICERIEITDWDAVDRYEGFMPSEPENSLYIRRPFMDGFIYEYNQEAHRAQRVVTGDWLDYTSQERGKNSGNFEKAA